MNEHISWATALRLLANLLTATTAVAWVKFADTRDGILSSPNIHHRVYLRVLIGLSVGAFLAGVLSLAVTAHATAGASSYAHAQAASCAPVTPAASKAAFVPQGSVQTPASNPPGAGG